MKFRALFVIAAIIVGGAVMVSMSSLHVFGAPETAAVAVDEYYQIGRAHV